MVVTYLFPHPLLVYAIRSGSKIFVRFPIRCRFRQAKTIESTVCRREFQSVFTFNSLNLISFVARHNGRKSLRPPNINGVNGKQNHIRKCLPCLHSPAMNALLLQFFFVLLLSSSVNSALVSAEWSEWVEVRIISRQ